MLFFLTLYSFKKPEKKNVSWFPQKYDSVVFNIDNNKCFLSSKSSY